MMTATRKPPPPLIVAYGWRQTKSPYRTQRWWGHESGLSVIQEVETHDGKEWLHVSLSRADRIPGWLDLTAVKDQFIGPGEKAIMVLPRREEHVNTHPFCLHLYACVEDDGLPDFRRAGGGL